MVVGLLLGRNYQFLVGREGVPSASESGRRIVPQAGRRREPRRIGIHAEDLGRKKFRKGSLTGRFLRDVNEME